MRHRTTVLLLTLAACSVGTVRVRQLESPATDRTTTVSTPVRAYLTDGTTVHYPGGGVASAARQRHCSERIRAHGPQGYCSLRDRHQAAVIGYRPIGPDFPGMGEHWISVPLLLDGSIDPARWADKTNQNREPI